MFAYCDHYAYAIGVPIGLGVELPRTPAVFPPKTRWSLPEQVDWGWESKRASLLTGSTKGNYASAKEHAGAVKKVLCAQAVEGQVITMTESEARARWGDRLTHAALGH